MSEIDKNEVPKIFSVKEFCLGQSIHFDGVPCKISKFPTENTVVLESQKISSSKWRYQKLTIEDLREYRRQRLEQIEKEKEHKAKACPFCGSDTERDDPYISDVLLETDEKPPKQYFFVSCGQCEASGPYGETEGEALDAWNERADDE